MAALDEGNSGIELMKAGDRVIFDINNCLKTNFITIAENACVLCLLKCHAFVPKCRYFRIDKMGRGDALHLD